MTTTSTDISPSNGGAKRDYPLSDAPDGQAPVLSGSGFEQVAFTMHDVGRRLDEYETKIRELQRALARALKEKQQLVDALRDLHGQFNSLQLHANKQCEVLLSEGEELRAARQQLASLQKELACTRAQFERSREQSAARTATTLEDASQQAAAEYRDALLRMERELERHQATAAAQERNRAELVRELSSLARRCKELDGKRAARETANAELRKTLVNRNQQIERLNKYVIRMRRELNMLDADEAASPVATAAKPPQKQKQRSASPVTRLIPGNRRKGERRRMNGKQHDALPPAPAPSGKGVPATQPLQARPIDAAKKRASASEQFVLVPVGDEAAWMQYPLSKKILTIGRSEANDIPVRDHCMSRFHARILVKDSRVFVEDMGSTNGLRLNSQLKKRFEVKHGDRFAVGQTEFELVDLAIRASGLRTA